MEGSATKSKEIQPPRIPFIPKNSFHHPKHEVAAMENYCHRAMTILKDEEKRKTEIQVVRANGCEPEQVDGVIEKMLARKGKQNTTMLK